MRRRKKGREIPESLFSTFRYEKKKDEIITLYQEGIKIKNNLTYHCDIYNEQRN